MTVRVSIEEFSVMTRLSRRVLSRYDELGVLEPAWQDPVTGHPHYDTSQVRRAQVIRYLRNLGMPAPEVRTMLTTPDVRVRNEVLAAHLGRTETELEKIRDTVGTLRVLLDPAQPGIQVELRSVPNIRAVAVTSTVKISELTAWWRDSLDELDSALASVGVDAAGPPGGLYAPEIMTEEEGSATVFIPVRSSVRPVGRVYPADIPPADLAVTVHDGPHNLIGRSYGALGSFVSEHGLGIRGAIRENYLVTAANADREGQQRTEICWPIYRTAIV